MKDEHLLNISIKIAITLTRLLETSKTSLSRAINKEEIADSYNKIALNSGLRKATVSDVFNAKSDPLSSTLMLIIKGMGYTLEEYAQIYDAIKEDEIKEFEKRKKRS